MHCSNLSEKELAAWLPLLRKLIYRLHSYTEDRDPEYAVRNYSFNRNCEPTYISYSFSHDFRF
jgi:hypothetical protein